MLIFGIPALVALALLIVVVLNDRRGRRRLRREVPALLADTPRDLPPFRHDDLAGLPEPVARCLRRNRKDGQALFRCVRYRQRGSIRLWHSRLWVDFTAQGYLRADRPAYLWVARLRPKIGALAFLWVDVRERWADAQGSRVIKALTTLRITDADGPEIAAATLSRYLAELITLPTALLPGAALRWAAIDADSARAVFHSGDQMVQADFTFNALGDITRVVVAQRPRAVRGGYVAERWTLTCAEHRLFDGYYAPTQITASWAGRGGEVTYFRAAFHAIETDLPAAF
ncbi:MAG: hypothetical protein GYB67_05410 [Chloroflexi bacterium]|nr:hypothetical protein [Chloroflexota bacterium]